MSTLGRRKWDVFPPGGNFNCCTAPGKNLCIVPPSLCSRSAPQGSTDVFQGFGKKILTSFLYCIFAFIGHLYSYCPELKHLMPVSSMWPIRPLVSRKYQRSNYTVNVLNWVLDFGPHSTANDMHFLKANCHTYFKHHLHAAFYEQKWNLQCISRNVLFTWFPHFYIFFKGKNILVNTSALQFYPCNSNNGHLTWFPQRESLSNRQKVLPQDFRTLFSIILL